MQQRLREYGGLSRQSDPPAFHAAEKLAAPARGLPGPQLSLIHIFKSVNGIAADYDADGYYWALSKAGEYLMTGVDDTLIADGEQYELVRTAA